MIDEHKQTLLQTLLWYEDAGDESPAPVRPQTVERSYEPSSMLSSLTGLTSMASGYAVGYATTAYTFFTSVPQLAVDFVREAIQEESAARQDDEKEDGNIVSPELNKLKAQLLIHSNNHRNMENTVKLLKKEISRLRGYLLHIDSFRSLPQINIMMKKISDYYSIRDKYFDRNVVMDELTCLLYGDDLNSREQEFEKMGFRTDTETLKDLYCKLQEYVNFPRDDKYEDELNPGTEAIVSYIMFADRFEEDRLNLDARSVKERQQVCDDFILLFKDVKDLNPYSLKYQHPRILDEIYKRTCVQFVTLSYELEIAEVESSQRSKMLMNLRNEFLAKQREVFAARDAMIPEAANAVEQPFSFVRADSSECNTPTFPTSLSVRP